MAFKYRGDDRSVEDVNRRAKMSGGAYDNYLNPDIPFFKPKEGDCTIRILPLAWDPDGTWGKKSDLKYGDDWAIMVWLHRNVGADNGTYLCLEKMLGEPCPCCEARADATDDDEADALKPQQRPMCFVIDRENEKAGPQVMSMAFKKVWQEIQTRSIDKKRNEVVRIDHPDDGYDILFSRAGSGLNTSYAGIEIDRDSTPIHDDIKKQNKWLDYIGANSLPEQFIFYDYDHIKKVLFGKSERRGKKGEVEEEQDRGSRRGRRGEAAEEAETTRSSRRAGRGEPTEETERPRRRGVEDSGDLTDAEESRTRSSRRGRDREEPAEEETSRSSRRSSREPEEEAGDPPSRTRSRGRSSGEEEPETGETNGDRRERPQRGRGREEPEEETGTRRGGGVERRRPREEPEEGAEESPSRQARDKLKGMRDRRGR